MNRKDFLLGSAALLGTRAYASPIRSLIGGRILEVSKQTDFTASDYVQDGLIVLFDAIENVAYGEHDNTASVWKNLIDDTDAQCSKTPLWGEKYFDCGEKERHWVYSSAGNIISSIREKSITVEVVVVSTHTMRNDNGLFCIGTSGWTANGFGVKYNNSTSNRVVDFLANQKTVKFSLPMTCPPMTMFASIDESTYTSGINGILKVIGSSSEDTIISDGKAFYMCRGMYNSGGLSGTVGGVRVYSRPLNVKEIEYNYMIDKERFGLA